MLLWLQTKRIDTMRLIRQILTNIDNIEKSKKNLFNESLYAPTRKQSSNQHRITRRSNSQHRFIVRQCIVVTIETSDQIGGEGIDDVQCCTRGMSHNRWHHMHLLLSKIIRILTHMKTNFSYTKFTTSKCCRSLHQLIRNLN